MDLNAKRQFIEAITDEVGELHPLLEAILPKLPNVKSYEYTHGQHERGADFILEVDNPTIRRSTHIGVVVKAGKIIGNKAGNVEEQIRECSEERFYKVMKRVRCNDVWIIASGGYSERVKEKFNERFRERNLQFLDAGDIASFIDDHYAYFWEKFPYDLGKYFQSLTARVAAADQATSVVAIPGAEQIYIELDVFERVNKTYAQGKSGPLTRNVDFFSAVTESKISLLEADMGFGKSRLARQLVLRLSSAESFRKTKTVPVFCSYKEFIDSHNGNLKTLVENHLGGAKQCLDDEEIAILAVLDGIDECCTDGSDSSELFEGVTKQCRASDKIRVLITTRPTKSLVDKATIYDSRTFGIRPLSIHKIVKFLEQACAKVNLPKRLYEDLKKSSLFRQLPHSPIAAALFSNLLAQNQQEVPQSLTELYSKSIELMLGRWDQKKQLAMEKQFATAQLVAEHLAEYFLNNSLICMSEQEARDQLTSYLSSRNTGIKREDIETLLFDRSNIFVKDSDLGTIAFRHRSFAEYLYAKRRTRDNSLNVSEFALHPYWVNVFFFYAGLRLDCPELLDELKKLTPQNEFEEWMKLLSVPNYLLAAYQTEFKAVEENVYAVLLDVARLYTRVRRGETQTRLVELSEMKLLFLFKSLVSEAFAYDFFSPAFEPTALRINGCSESDDIKHYAIFFLGCAAISVGNKELFNFLVKEVGPERLPLPISLAIRCELESSSNVENSSLLQLHRTRLRKLIGSVGKENKSAGISVRDNIEELFKRPIKMRLKKLAKAS